MDTIWFFKHCPRCGNYLKKLDPQESAMCCSCGWQEYVAPYYCEFRRRFCSEEPGFPCVQEKVYHTVIR